MPASVEAACWICGSRALTVWKQRSTAAALTPADLQITDSRYGQTLTLHRCGACGFIQAAGDEVRELVALYERLDDPEYETTQDTRALQMKWLLDETLRSRPQIRTWLDVGAGAGLLVAEARRRGLEATGIEPSRSLVAAAPRVNGVELLQGTFPHPALAGQTFDAISLVDVIEHVANPVELLTNCHTALADGGVLLVVTPDVRSLLARLLGKRWWHLRLAHVGYFDRASLSRAGEQAGLRATGWFRACWFFRASYLAERLEKYLPLGWFNRWASGTWLFAPLYRRIVRLNLHDSWVVLFQKKPRTGP